MNIPLVPFGTMSCQLSRTHKTRKTMHRLFSSLLYASRNRQERKERKDAPGDLRHLSLFCTMYMLMYMQWVQIRRHTTRCPCVCSHSLLPGSPVASPGTEYSRVPFSFFVLFTLLSLRFPLLPIASVASVLLYSTYLSSACSSPSPLCPPWSSLLRCPWHD